MICNRDCGFLYCCNPSIMLCDHSLWVKFVERAVHSNCDAELIEATVQTDFIHHGCQTGSTQLCCSFGHDAANLLHKNTVITCTAGQTQMLQDGADLPQCQTITAKKSSINLTDNNNNQKLKTNCFAYLLPQDKKSN